MCKVSREVADFIKNKTGLQPVSRPVERVHGAKMCSMGNYILAGKNRAFRRELSKQVLAGKNRTFCER